MKMKNKNSKKLKTISFDEETVSKHAAEEILSKNENSSESQKHKKRKKRKLQLQEDINESGSNKLTENSNEDKSSPPKSKKKKKQSDPTVSQAENEKLPRRKKNKKQSVEEINEETKTESKDKEKDNEEPADPPEKKKESIRELRRKRHLKLLEEKKMKSELQMQQKSLNYLSKWKHSREEWKFEKLRQIWLLHNMYDSAKIPEEFWGVLLEYFSNSKGKIRDTILKDAIKLIDETSEDDENQIKVQRARDIVQNLQE